MSRVKKRQIYPVQSWGTSKLGPANRVECAPQHLVYAHREQVDAQVRIALRVAVDGHIADLAAGVAVTHPCGASLEGTDARTGGLAARAEVEKKQPRDAAGEPLRCNGFEIVADDRGWYVRALIIANDAALRVHLSNRSLVPTIPLYRRARRVPRARRAVGARTRK